MSVPRPRLMYAIHTLSTRWPRANMDREMMLAYAADLEDLCVLDEQNVISAINELRLSATFLPQVGNIREKAAELMARDLWVVEAAAWGEVNAAITRYGRDKKTIVLKEIDGKEYGVEEVFPGFSSPLVDAAVAAVGWDDLCLADRSTDKGVIRGQFRKALEGIQERVKYEVMSGRYLSIDPDRMLGDGHRGPRQIGDVIAGMIEARSKETS